MYILKIHLSAEASQQYYSFSYGILKTIFWSFIYFVKLFFIMNTYIVIVRNASLNEIRSVNKNDNFIF